MERVPLEVIARHASHEVAKFFAEKVETERKHKKVAVIVEDFTNQLYFIKCNDEGYPDYYTMRYMSLDSMSLSVLMDGATPATSTMSVEEVEVMLEKPLISYRYDYTKFPYIFLWQGRKMSKRKIPLEKLNVKELMKLAQEAIKNREGLIIDEALNNKIYK